MGKAHLRRLAAPKVWQIRRKEHKFISKPKPGPHSLDSCISISTLLKEILGMANKTREVKKILGGSNIKIDGKLRKEHRFPVGIFDIIELPATNEYFRVILNTKGKIDMLKISKEESSHKPCKIIGKTASKGKIQINLYDGKNLLVSNGSYKVGDTVLLSLPEQKIVKHFKIDKKSFIFLTGGKHIGEVGNIEDVSGEKIIYKNVRGDLVETSKKFAFVIGDSAPSIKLQ